MVPDSPPSGSASPNPASGPESTDGTGPGIDEATLYRVIRTAVKDALLDVIGTLLLVGIAFVLVIAGGRAILSGATTPSIVVGGVFVAVGLYLAAATLEIIPPIRVWL
jgi:hypothetical protein